MMQTEVWTIGRLLEWTTDYLRKHGSETPRLDAEVLLSHACSCSRIQLYTSFAEEADEPTRTAFRELIKRRAQGTPVAYLVGHKEFYSLPFYVSPDVLIPRSETEHLVVEALDCIKQLRAKQTNPTSCLIADVGTGSGCIAAAIARHAADCRILAMDLSPSALKVAQRNFETLGLDARIDSMQSDLFQAVPDELRFDLIVSNPPYVSQSEFDQLSKSVRDYEPRLALVAGDDGLAIIDRLLNESAQRMKEGGYLMFEISPMIAPNVATRIENDSRWKLLRIVKDLAGLPRVAVVQLACTTASRGAEVPELKAPSPEEST